MPRLCPDCEEQVEPVAMPFLTPNYEGWFLVCPSCHYVFGKLPASWFHDDPADRVPE